MIFFQNIYFRSPGDLLALVSGEVEIHTAIHFQKDDPIELITEIEKDGQDSKEDTGAFLPMRWRKFQ